MHIGDSVADRFLLERLAGSGGMGDVYQALDQRTGHPVAVKVLRGQHASDAARFEREARILGELSDALIVRHVAHGALPSGDQYLVMEWLEGEDLAARLARGRLGAQDSVSLAITVAEALSVLHDRGIVHRDLKPSNVFLVEGRLERVKLLDFGIAQVGAETRVTGTGVLVGTPAYMAPEQARGEDRLSARVDVFALGCVLFECLTGGPAFSASHVMAILAKILFDEPPRLRDRLPGAPATLEAIVFRMLSKRPGDRPDDGRAAAEALRALGKIQVTGSAAAGDETVELQAPSALTGSEQRALAVLLIGAPALSTGGPDTPGSASPSSDVTRVAELGDPEIKAEAEAYGGRFERLLGGSAAVLFSDTAVATDLAVRAARCALSLQQRVGGRRLALAMGRGEGSGRLPMGPAIDRAARLLEGEASAGLDLPSAPIALDDATVRLLDARFDVREDSGVSSLHGEREVADARMLLGKATPCVGRERELRMLEGLFEDCAREGGAQAVVVTAPPGVGKSRLGREFLRKVQARGDPLRSGSVFGLLAELIQRACGIRGGEPLDVRRDRLESRVAERIDEGERPRVAEFLGEVSGVLFPDEQSLRLRAARRDAQLMHDQIRSAFLDFVRAECSANPVLIVLEDLHWGDSPTVQLLDRALRDLDEKPLFVLALARPELASVFPELWAGRSHQEIRLRELPKKAAERLARHVLGERAGVEAIERIVRLADGNAFYLEELIRAAAEGSIHDLPETVVAMVQSRLGALDDESRRLLRAASVFGETFWAGGVAALVGGTTRVTGVVDKLGALGKWELIQKKSESRFPDEDEHTFRHALLREGAYSMLTDQDLALGHRLAGEWLEQRGEDDPLVLAGHFEKGGERARASLHYLRAAERLIWGGATVGAIAQVERGLAGAVSVDVRARLLGVLCQLHYYRLEMAPAALPYAEELLCTTERGSTPWARALLIKLTGSVLTGKMADFAEALREIMAAEIEPDAVEPASLTLATACYLLDVSGHIQEGAAVLERLGALVRLAGDRAPSSSGLWGLLTSIRSAYAQEDPWTGLLYGRSSRALFEAMGHGVYFFANQLLMAMNAWLLGENAEARRHFKEARLPDDEAGYASSVRLFVLSWMLADLGSLVEAREYAERLVASGRARSVQLDEARGLWALGEVLRRAGDFEAAEAAIGAALAIFSVACPLDHPGALATLAALRLAQGRPAEALSAAQEGFVKYESTGACSQFFRSAFLRLVHAESLEATGDHAAARAAIVAARARLLAVADTIGEATYRTSFLENVPENRRTLELAQLWESEGAGAPGQ